MCFCISMFVMALFLEFSFSSLFLIKKRWLRPPDFLKRDADSWSEVCTRELICEFVICSIVSMQMMSQQGCRSQCVVTFQPVVGSNSVKSNNIKKSTHLRYYEGYVTFQSMFLYFLLYFIYNLEKNMSILSCKLRTGFIQI